MYLSHTSTGDLKLEVESKFFPGEPYRIAGLKANRKWLPSVIEWTDRREVGPTKAPQLPPKQQRVMDIIANSPVPLTDLQVAQAQGFEKTGFTGNYLKLLERKGLIQNLGGRPRTWAPT